jgi:hypothetical protein
MLISTKAEKAFDRIQGSFVVKKTKKKKKETIKQTRNREKLPQCNEGHI